MIKMDYFSNKPHKENEDLLKQKDKEEIKNNSFDKTSQSQGKDIGVVVDIPKEEPPTQEPTTKQSHHLKKN
jgi:hypothetical protein